MGQKIIHLVRHGHFQSSGTGSDPLGNSLSDLGREQAYLVAQRLRQFPIDCIHYSSMRRAAETASVIATEFPGVPLQASELLWEFSWKVFTDAVYALTGRGEALEQVEQTKQRIAIAFEQYFSPCLTEANQHEIVVCHGNIIRYFVCRALQISPETSSSMESANCGISTFSIDTSGRLMLITYNDIGHLPLAKQTYIRYVPVGHL
ncbi:hypothetical protein HJG54_30015 [Leptolyngbya sp. NK1-12]|uniref:Histidine phosphatase family protein n=1 Tax=Leptolyngbya sp. NK1-12 TaxID=2547451 RepID=A0AA96WKM1_9CYAN|nr:histidine phosphatase family protein [Elainella sp. C42_A2020_010]WNZ27148.1 hypothetical protein HJG54_30015 [Leptolyngbya sp. NK1-12]